MRYDHLVKYNGIYYKAGEEVPDGASSDVLDNTEKENEDLPTTTEEQSGNHLEEKSDYKKSDIQRMNKEGLVALATELSIEFTEETSGNVLKELIIEKLGL